MESGTTKLKGNLKKAGLSDQAINAAWPAWWSDEAEGSSSARAELRFAVARKLGVSPTSLLDDRVEFVWKDAARFKHLREEGVAEQSALASFGVAVGRLLMQGARHIEAIKVPSAEKLRAAMLQEAQFIDLTGLVAMCWAFGIPVIHLRVFPLASKAMHAMVVRVDDRYVILLGKDARYPAPVAFTLAHELGHLALNHLRDASALVDLDDPTTATDGDQEETEADRFALSLLTGSPEPDIRTNVKDFGPAQLAKAVLTAGPNLGIEPGTLALCYAYRTDNWARAMAALRHIYSEAKPVWSEVNHVAWSQIEWRSMSDDSADFLRNVMGMPDA